MLGKNQGVTAANTVDLESTNFIFTRIIEEISLGIINQVPAQPNIILNEDCDSTTASPSKTFKPSIIDSSERNEMEDLASYLAKKFYKKHNNMGTRIEEEENPHDYSLPGSVQYLSSSGFIQPSSKWLTEFYHLEEIFNKFHKKNLRLGPNIIIRTTKFIKKRLNYDIPDDVINEFSKRRIFMRIKFLNAKLGDTKRKINCSHKKLIKKVKKISN